MPRSSRRALSFVFALTLSLSLSACGDKDTATTPDGSGSKAPAATESRDALTQDDFAERVFGAIEKSGSAHAQFEAGAGQQKFSGDGEVEYGDQLALKMQMTPAGGAAAPQEVLLIGEMFYLKVGDKYLAMSLSAMSGQGMPDFSANLDPKVQAEAFAKAVSGFKQAGPAETLDGVKATPYEVTLDPTKAPETFGTTSTKPLKFTYYVGPDDLPRKMVFHDPSGDFSATYTQWGAPVDIKPPAASQIMQGMG